MPRAETATRQVALPPERRGRSAAVELVAAREGMLRLAQERCRNGKIVPTEERLGGVRVLRFTPRLVARAQVLHFHGGGYRIGCPEYLAPFAVALAERCQVEVLCPAYRLAPEHPYPDALHDARAVLRELARSISVPCIVSGDSAGGGLAAALALLARDQALPLAGLVLLSAWLDLTLRAQSYISNAVSDRMFSLDSARQAADLYLQGAAAQDLLASPVLASLGGLPASFVSVGPGEVLFDDSRCFYESLQAAGVSAEFCAPADMAHIAVVRDMSLPGAAETFAALCAFLEGRLQNTTPAALSSKIASSL